MATTTDYLTQLQEDKDTLVDNLTEQGITGLTGDETFTELVPKVLDIESGGGKYKPKILSFASNTISSLTPAIRTATSLQEEIESIDTSDVTNMSGLFYNASALTSVDISSWNTSKVTDMSGLFYTCQALQTIDISDIDTSSVTNMSQMFYNCRNLNNLNWSTLDTSNVTNMDSMFYQAKATNVDLSVLRIPDGKSCTMNYMFADSRGLPDLTKLSLKNVTSIENMFNGITASYYTGAYDLSNLDTSGITSMRGLFKGNTGVTSIDMHDIDDSKVYNAYELFNGCSNLQSINLKGVSFKNVLFRNNGYGYMFNGCSSLTTLDISDFNPVTVDSQIQTQYMFFDCKLLTKIDMRSIDFHNISSSSSYYRDMFGPSATRGVPDDCEIIVKDDYAKNWITSKFTRLTNVKTVAEYEAE